MGKIDVRTLSRLSKITLSDNTQLKNVESAIDETLAYVENLSELDVTNVEPTYSPIGAINVGFQDETDDTRKLKPNIFEVESIL